MILYFGPVYASSLILLSRKETSCSARVDFPLQGYPVIVIKAIEKIQKSFRFHTMVVYERGTNAIDGLQTSYLILIY